MTMYLEAFFADIEFSEEEPEPGTQEKDVVHTESPSLSEEQLEERRLRRIKRNGSRTFDSLSNTTDEEEKWTCFWNHISPLWSLSS